MRSKPAYRIAFSGLLLALSLALSFAEGTLPALPMLPPGAKLGLSNIVTMYAAFFLGARQALCIAVLKSLFVFLTRGATGAFLSLLGGLLSVCAMILLRKIPGLSVLFVSIGGAVMHNLGQLLGAVLLLHDLKTLWYAPVLILCGIAAGFLTGLLLRFVMPALQRLDRNFDK